MDKKKTNRDKLKEVFGIDLGKNTDFYLFYLKHVDIEQEINEDDSPEYICSSMYLDNWLNAEYGEPLESNKKLMDEHKNSKLKRIIAKKEDCIVDCWDGSIQIGEDHRLNNYLNEYLNGNIRNHYVKDGDTHEK